MKGSSSKLSIKSNAADGNVTVKHEVLENSVISGNHATNGDASTAGGTMHDSFAAQEVCNVKVHPETDHITDAAVSSNDGEEIEGEIDTELQLQLLMEEEKKAAEKNKKAEEKMLQEMEARRAEEKELQEQRHARLMHLLTKSQFYSQFLLEKIESQTEKQRQKEAAAAKKKKKAAIAQHDEDKENSDGSSKKRQVSPSADVGGRPGKRKKQVSSTSYLITEVIDKEVVADAAAGGRHDNGSSSTATTEEEGISVRQPQLLSGATLRPYQLEGFNWLKVMYENGINGLLADEMGLGKTIQSLALLCHLVEMNVPGPFLVVAPLSTLHNWCNEIKRWAPQLPHVLFHGTEAERNQKLPLVSRPSLVRVTDPDGGERIINVLPITVTSYEMAICSEKQLARFRWRYLVVDEGHRIKNFECRLVRSLRQYVSSNRLLLTGTPLQNSLAELWSLLNFLLPEVFDSLDVFESWFDVAKMSEHGAEARLLQQEREMAIISTLHKILSPFLLRRVKADVALHLPPKRELLVFAPLTPLQLKLYKATITRDYAAFSSVSEAVEETRYDCKGRPVRKSTAEAALRLKDLLEADDTPEGLEKFLVAAVVKGDGSSSTVRSTTSGVNKKMNVKLQNISMQCRRIVNHPYLLAYPLTAEGEYMVDEAIVSSCGKLRVLDQLLQALHSRGHKVLLFSQMTKLLDILHDYLTLRPQYDYRRLDGSVSLQQRQEDIDAFNNDSSVFLFLLSTRAGSLGINLTAADTVIIYDSDWNPQQDVQAQDRCHRLGQTRPVLVLRLVTAATVDEHMVTRANSKRCLEKLIMKAGHFTGGVQRHQRVLESTMESEELLRLLEQRDHHAVYKSGGVLSQGQLDGILDRSEMVRKTNIETNNNEDGSTTGTNEKRENVAAVDGTSKNGVVDDKERVRNVFQVVECE